MFSSLSSDARNLARNTRNGPPKQSETSRGFSVHVFKNAAPPPPPSQPVYASLKSQAGQEWSTATDSSRPKFERKGSLTPKDAHRTAQPAVYVDSKRTKSSRGRNNYPYSSNDPYIYDRSFSIAADALATSPSSSSSESDMFSESAVAASIDISSTRASSSTETLETSALAIQYPTSTPARPVYPRAGSYADWSRITPDGSRILPPGLPPISRSTSYRSGGAPGPGPIWIPAYPETDDDETEDDTYFDDDIDIQVQRRPTFSSRDEVARDPRYIVPQPAPAPVRRYSDERSSAEQLSRPRVAVDDTRNAIIPPAPASGLQNRLDNPSAPRAPSGVSRASDSRNAPNDAVYGASTDDGRRQQQAGTLPRTNTMAPASAMETWRPEARPAAGLPQSSSQANVRTDDPRVDVSAPSMSRSNSTAAGVLTVATRRAVRWTEDLMCPCPVPRSQRRKGWFNRRGDQLWTNDGRFKPPEPSKEYPPDLVGYPEPNMGWMNEEGVRIDMEHCLIPKPPLRSALKRPKNAAGTQ